MTMEEASWHNLIITIVKAETMTRHGELERGTVKTQLTTVCFEDGGRINDPRNVNNP